MEKYLEKKQEQRRSTFRVNENRRKKSKEKEEEELRRNKAEVWKFINKKSTKREWTENNTGREEWE